MSEVGITPSIEHQIEAEVTRLLKPFDEADEWFAEGSRWDWWVVGGRWDGEILNLDRLEFTKTCELCNGTGDRPGLIKRTSQEWYDECNGCNGCNGTGRANASYENFDALTTLVRNLARVKDVPADYLFSSFIGPDGTWNETGRAGWFGTTISDEDGESEDSLVAKFDQAWAQVRDEFPNNIAVAVDCHV